MTIVEHARDRGPDRGRELFSQKIVSHCLNQFTQFDVAVKHHLHAAAKELETTLPKGDKAVEAFYEEELPESLVQKTLELIRQTSHLVQTSEWLRTQQSVLGVPDDQLDAELNREYGPIQQLDALVAVIQKAEDLHTLREALEEAYTIMGVSSPANRFRLLEGYDKRAH